MMRSPCSHSRSFLGLVAALFLLTSFSACFGAQADVTLNFVNADIDQVAKAIGAATHETIIVDPRVKGQITLTSEQPVDRDVAMKSLEATLRMQGFAMVEDHGILKVVPEADAKVQGVPTGIGNVPAYRGDQIITQVFTLKNESANNLLPVLRPLITPNNTITAYPANNTLVVTDYADNVRRIAAIIRGIDGQSSSDVQVIQVHNANAGEVANTVQKMLDPNSTGANDPTLKVAVTPDPRTNSIILRASNQARMQMAKRLIERLDAPGLPSGNMHVVHLHNADAVRLAATLRGMMGGGGGGATGAARSGDTSTPTGGLAASTGTAGSAPLPTGSSAGAGLGGASSGSSQAGLGSGGAAFTTSEQEAQQQGAGGMIQADSATNSLIITAPDPVFRNLQAVIQELDARRAQVYIESLIAEIDYDKERQFGIQWQGVAGSHNNGVYTGTNFGTGGQNIVDLTAGAYAAKSNPSSLVLPAEGLNIGILHRFGNILGIGGLLQALDNLTGVNVLSTPALMTLDNEEAKIVVGQNVPFITGSYAQTGTTATVTPFQTYDREDVGITLRVRPQIAQDGTIKLQIYQESSSVVTGSESNPGGVTTNKRSLQSTILCDNGQILVLGGLIQDQYNESTNKVPVLGDIPYLGTLFRSEDHTHTKTNLMIFLRPVIVHDAADSAAISQNRYDLLRDMSQNYRPDSQSLGTPATPALPAVPVKPTSPGVPQQYLDPHDQPEAGQFDPKRGPGP